MGTLGYHDILGGNQPARKDRKREDGGNRAHGYIPARKKSNFLLLRKHKETREIVHGMFNRTAFLNHAIAPDLKE